MAFIDYRAEMPWPDIDLQNTNSPDLTTG